KQVDVEKKLLGLLRTTYAKAGKTKQEVLQTIEELDIEIQRREETMIQFRQKLSVIPESFEVPDSKFEIYGRVASTGEPESFALDFILLKKWLHISVYSPAKEYFVAIFEDIAERKRAEKELRVNEKRLQMAQEICHIGCWEYDIKTNRMWGSREGCHLFGYPRMAGSFPIENFTSCITEPESVLKAFNDLINEGKEYDLEFIINPKDGSAPRTLHNIGKLEKDEQGNPVKVKGITQDITERKQAEDALLQVNRQLNLLSSITRHDITNQLLVLKGYLELSHDVIDNPEALKEYIKKEQQAANTIEEQIMFTKDFRELGAVAPAWQSVNTSIKKAVDMLPMRAVRVEVDPADPEVYANPLFEKVFYNLIDNALRYGGDRMNTLRISSEESDRGFTLICEDDGIGISAEDKKRLFTRGFGKNTGLGLFLSQEILSITGITIIENGEPGTGARFEIAVPKGAWRFTATGEK
ncbi:MAG: ATP-binding protein, partial [Methanoregula sp.]|nr:ATP-binding protein [Methanoregula sp.]